MSARAETVAWAAALAVLSALVVVEGGRRAELERRVPVGPRELYRTLARSASGVQVVDLRPDLENGYSESHVPGAIPLPGCDPEKAPPGAGDRIHRSVPTVLVSGDGDGEALSRCVARFTAARTLAGGMDAWERERLPEDVGDYTPPSAKAGGGCL
jgi:rhodanese-related sulfurtransferase